MQFLIFSIFCSAGLIFFAESVFFLSLDNNHSHSPLYQSVSQLLVEEKLRVEKIWHETNYTIENSTNHIHQKLEQCQQQQLEIEATLGKVYNISQEKEMHFCTTKFEREIAHLNRLLLDAYGVCKLSLESALHQVLAKSHSHLSYLRTAPIRIQSVRGHCNVTDLKYEPKDLHTHAGIVFCVLGQLGEINNYHYGTLRLGRELLMEIKDAANDNCTDFENIKPQIDYIHLEITECVETL